jgi:hypothetical protein
LVSVPARFAAALTWDAVNTGNSTTIDALSAASAGKTNVLFTDCDELNTHFQK